MIQYNIVDVFTDSALQGNPVAVFHDAADIPADRMQQIAREMNLSEVTFTLPPRSADADLRVRIFTPCNELPFAGHPLLGTAIALGGQRSCEVLRLETSRGIIPFRFDRSGMVLSASMVQPLPTIVPFDRTDELLAALGMRASLLPVEMYCNGPRHVFVTLDLAALTILEPDQRALARFPDMATNCVAARGTQWRMRMFSPAYGVAEDAATGSAAGPLAVHLVRHGQVPPGQEIEILQGVEMGRTSRMHAVARGDGVRINEIVVSGSAVVVAQGTFFS
ncbi:MAG: PhzF family phenazine biosynthesis protein [Brevibacterium aurantiacum]|nr:PhzF family phenazine biosynthesis protein [Brevibacterium aurantiacum]